MAWRLWDFNGTVQETYEFTNDQIGRPENLRLLRAVFENSDYLKPQCWTWTSASRWRHRATSYTFSAYLALSPLGGWQCLLLLGSQPLLLAAFYLLDALGHRQILGHSAA